MSSQATNTDNNKNLTINGAQVLSVREARNTLTEVLFHLATAEAHIRSATEVNGRAMQQWDKGGVVDEPERVLLDSTDYCLEGLRDRVREMILRYAPLAYGTTEGDNKDLAPGHEREKFA